MENVLNFRKKIFPIYLAEFREVDEAVPDYVIGQVDDLLLHRVQSQHLHSRVKVLGVDGGLPQTCLVAPKDCRDDVKLLLSELLPLLQGTVKVHVFKG